MVNIDLSQFDNVPAGMPPPGVTPNLIDPPSRAALPKYFALTTLPLMLVFLFLRLYTRVAITRKFGIDDGELDLHRPSIEFVCLFTDTFTPFLRPLHPRSCEFLNLNVLPLE